jgi:hypothetical protein
MHANRWLFASLVLIAGLGTTGAILTQSRPTAVEVLVYKTPWCGCCGKWVEHMRQNGFTVKVEDMTDLGPVKQRLGVAMHLQSCHTAVIGKHVIEGHVPADVIRRFLKQPPAAAIGLAVPGMPRGAPGMESPNPQPYDILVFEAGDRARVYEKR